MRRLLGRIVHCALGEEFTKNEFCLIVRDAAKSVLLSPMRTTWGRSPIMYAAGAPVLAGEVPVKPTAKLEVLAGRSRTFRAIKRKDRDGNITFHADGRHFVLWDGLPKDGERVWA